MELKHVTLPYNFNYKLAPCVYDVCIGLGIKPIKHDRLTFKVHFVSMDNDNIVVKIKCLTIPYLDSFCIAIPQDIFDDRARINRFLQELLDTEFLDEYIFSYDFIHYQYDKQFEKELAKTAKYPEKVASLMLHKHRRLNNGN